MAAYSVNMADNLMLGSYGQTALSGAATVNQRQFLVQQATIAIGNGMVMLNAQYWGKRELSLIRSITGIALKGRLVFWVVLLLNSDQIFKCIPVAIRANSYKWVHVMTRTEH